MYLHASLSIYHFMQEGYSDIANLTVQQVTTHGLQSGMGDDRAQGPVDPFTVTDNVCSPFHQE
jgi:hypothetical protein